MKKLSSFPIMTIFCVLIFSLFSGVECNESDDPKCAGFISEILTWRPTPIAHTDRTLDPSQHYQGLVGTENACLYWYKSSFFELCREEAIIFNVTIEIKEEYKDKIYSNGAFIDFTKGNFVKIDNYKYSTENGVYIITGELTVSGNSDHYLEGVERVPFECNVHVAIKQQTDIESTHAFFNNIVHSIKINYAYTKP